MVDVLIIGGGGAGLTAAIFAKQNGASVTLVSKTYPTRSQTCMAQGGINAAIGADDSVQSHISDTLKSAQDLADEELVAILCEQGIDAIKWLDSIGVPFSRNNGIAQRKMGGASSVRACYAKDYTGLKILHTLYDQCNAHDIKMLSERFLVDLAITDGRVCGAYFLNIKTSAVEFIKAKNVILATGGYARLYGKHSTNHVGSTADGIAAALRAGAKISNMEFIQFHPTTLKKSSILISESSRGAGGYLINSKNERFTDELASRDKVSLAIINEMQKGEDIYLDVRHLPSEFIDEHLPQEKKLASLYENIDLTKQPIPILPAAHYTMGGICVDKDCATNIQGLYAVGECANHRVHGANRLGGNSLLEIVVFGKIAAQAASRNIDMFACKANKSEDILSLINTNPTVDFYKKREELAEVFYKNVGIKRNKQGLMEALRYVEKLQNELQYMGVKETKLAYNIQLAEFLEFKNLVLIAQSVILSALRRKESRGAHYREDMPNKDDNCNVDTVCYLENNDIRFIN